MEHYFTRVPAVENNEITFDLRYGGREYRFITASGVFSRGKADVATLFMLKHALPFLRGRVLDLGCGYGLAGVIVRRTADDTGNTAEIGAVSGVVCVDINERATELTRRNAELNGVDIDVVVSDGFSDISGGFDCVLFNPPVHAGKAVIYRLFEQARERSRVLFTVIQKKHGAESALAELNNIYGGNVTVIRKKSGIYLIKSENAVENAVENEKCGV